jgi:hypothetical protein
MAKPQAARLKTKEDRDMHDPLFLSLLPGTPGNDTKKRMITDCLNRS